MESKHYLRSLYVLSVGDVFDCISRQYVLLFIYKVSTSMWHVGKRRDSQRTTSGAVTGSCLARSPKLAVNKRRQLATWPQY